VVVLVLVPVQPTFIVKLTGFPLLIGKPGFATRCCGTRRRTSGGAGWR
jgi:hypothetical protein